MSDNVLRHEDVQKQLSQADKPDPLVEALVNDVIARVADKWTMLILEALAEHGKLRFTQLAKHVAGISQKMLTHTLRDMEREKGWLFVRFILSYHQKWNTS